MFNMNMTHLVVKQYDLSITKLYTQFPQLKMVCLIQSILKIMTYGQTFNQKSSTKKIFQGKQSSYLIILFFQQLIKMLYLTYQYDDQYLQRLMRVIVWNLPQDLNGIHMQKKDYFCYLKLISTKTLIYWRQIQYQMSSFLVDSAIQHSIFLCCIITLYQLMYCCLISNLMNFVPFM